jgi:hypothetical protein
MLCWCVLASFATLAQNNVGVPLNPELTITVGERQLKFAPTRPFQAMRYQVFNDLGELVFGAATAEAELLWPLKTNNGEMLAPGLYSYVLTLKYGEHDERRHTGHFIVEKGQDQIWLTADDGADISGTALNAARAGGRSIAGPATAEGKVQRGVVNQSGAQPIAHSPETRPLLNVKAALLGTVNRLAKFDVGGVNIIDSALIETGGNVGLGTTSPNAKFSVSANTAAPPSAPGVIAYFANSDESNTFLTADAYGNGNVHSDFLFRRARGTMAVPAAVQTDDIVGQIQMRGYGTTGFATTSRAGIRLTAAENWSDTAQGAYLAFMTTPKLSNTINVERMRITDAGNVGIGVTAPVAKLEVAGIIHSTTGGIKFPDGSTQTTAAAGGGDITEVNAGTGLTGGATSGAATLGIVAGGVTALELATNAVTTAKLADASVTNVKIVDVAGSKVSGAVANATTAVNFSGALAGDVTGTQSTTAITAGAVTTAKLADANVTTAKLADASVTTAKLADSSVTDAKIVGMAGSKITGTIPVAALPAGSTHYIQNQNAGQQASANFNISGNGTAGGTLTGNVVSATTQFNIGLSRVVSIPGTNNTFVGLNTGVANTTGSFNAFFGTSAGASNSTGGTNSFFGSSAGLSNTSGGSNSFYGSGAGLNNTTGNSNSIFGRDAGFSNTTGGGNAFFGHNAGNANTTANSNSFFGFVAGEKNTTGQQNSFFGAGAGNNNTTGPGNSFFGFGAGNANTTAHSNSFFGFVAGEKTTTGQENSFFGSGAGNNNTTGSGNSFFGREAGVNNTTGFSNSFFGIAAGFFTTTGEGNSFFGSGAGNKNTTGLGNAFFGREAGFNNTTGFYNSFFGHGAGNGNTTGNLNSFYGIAAGGHNTEGSNNTFLGRGAGNNNTTGNANTIIGMEAGLSNTTESANTFIGVSANGVAGINNATALGAGAVVTQSDSVVLGNNASVGIGVSAPKAKLDIRNGNVYVGSAGQGMILKSPDGATCRLLTIDNTGTLVLSAISCP